MHEGAAKNVRFGFRAHKTQPTHFRRRLGHIANHVAVGLHRRWCRCFGTVEFHRRRLCSRVGPRFVQIDRRFRVGCPHGAPPAARSAHSRFSWRGEATPGQSSPNVHEARHTRSTGRSRRRLYQAMAAPGYLGMISNGADVGERRIDHRAANRAR